MAPKLTIPEAQYIQGVSEQTGIDPRDLLTWIGAEGAPGNEAYNYMNIKTSTAQSLGLGNEADKTPAQTFTDIAATNWAQSHYGGTGGPWLVADFQNDGFGSPNSPYQGPSAVVGDPAVTGAVTSVEKAVTAPLSSLTDFFNFITSIRATELVGGFLLLLVGLILLGRQLGVNGPGGPLGKLATQTQDQAPSPAETRAQSRETRSAEIHQSRIELNRARVTNQRSQSRNRTTLARQTKAQRAAAEKSAYYRGAADAGSSL